MITILEEAPYGSTFIFGYGEDDDKLLLVPSQIDARLEVERLGYQMCSKYADGDFFSVRKGRINLIITSNLNWFRLSAYAAQVCKELANRGVITYSMKSYRVNIHRAIRGEL